MILCTNNLVSNILTGITTLYVYLSYDEINASKLCDGSVCT